MNNAGIIGSPSERKQSHSPYLTQEVSWRFNKRKKLKYQNKIFKSRRDLPQQYKKCQQYVREKTTKFKTMKVLAKTLVACDGLKTKSTPKLTKKGKTTQYKNRPQVVRYILKQVVLFLLITLTKILNRAVILQAVRYVRKQVIYILLVER